MINELNKMLAGELYDPSEGRLSKMRADARDIIAQYNLTTTEQQGHRGDLLKKLFADIGNGIKIEPHFNCDYGKNITVGDNFYVNFGCVILDCALVNIGDNCLIGPQVGIYTACHPIDPIQRKSGFEFAKAINIGDNCWIGGHAIINPGVTLGNNVIVASGAVVTKSFADNVVIAGNPARVIKKIE